MDAALVFPMLIMLTFGSVEFGYFFFAKHTFQGAAREGARAAINAGSTNADVLAAVSRSMTAAGFAPAKYTVAIRNASDTANVDVATRARNSSILVRVSSPWNTVKVMPPLLLHTTRSDGTVRVVAGQTVMRKE
jgi:Flp pilus assembly protein TadG